MSLTFPRDLPAAGVTRETFEIDRVDFLSPDSSGRLGAISAGFPLWMAEWTLPSKGQARADEWRAWVGLAARARPTVLWPRDAPSATTGLSGD